MGVTMMLLFVLIALPNFSTANVCLFNQSDIVPRKEILLNQGNHQYIHIQNATINVDLKKSEEYMSSFLWILFYNVTAIRFTGNVSIIGNESENYEMNITKLEGVRGHFRKRKTCECSISFVENEEINYKVQPEVENAIIRLAQSCIRSVLCQSDMNEIDKDANLNYASVQSTLNELFDHFVPKITPTNLRSQDYVSDLKYKVVKVLVPLMIFHSFNVTNFSTIRRLRDVVILSHGSNKFTVSGMFRFNDVNFSVLKSRFVLGEAYISIFSNYFTINVTFEFDLSPNSCHGKVVFLDIMYANNSTTGNVLVDWAIKSAILDHANDLIAGTSFGCEDPVNKALIKMLPFN